MDDDELAEYIEKYDRLVEKTFDDCQNEFENKDDWDYQKVWEGAQGTCAHLFPNDNVFMLKITEAAVRKERDEPIDWGKAKQRIIEYGQAHTHDPVSEFLPSYYAMFAGDELINHAVAVDVMQKLESSG